ncbi:MAG: hypothetical protein HC927_00845 [Deltaproteobacteria bacterium]|nr:hypothetical protein [Deltaproteobacteria bacterium]
MQRHRHFKRFASVLPCFIVAGWVNGAFAAPPEEGEEGGDDNGFEFDEGEEGDFDDADVIEEVVVAPPDEGEGEGEGDAPGEDDDTISEDDGFVFEDISEDEEALAAELKSGEVQAEGTTGTITGVIANAKNEPLPGVYVRAKGTDYVARTGVDGRYELKLPPGVHTLVIELDLYQGKEIANVNVVANEAASQDVELIPMAGVQETYEVKDDLNLEAEGALQEARKQKTTVNDGIDATEISKSGGGKVSSVAVRIVGATVVKGRYLFVRGLGHRYGNTLLDGARVPSPEPELRTVPLDVFPSGALSAIDVQKTFSPDVPGDFTGGSTQFVTRDVPSEPLVKIEVGTGVNVNTSYQPMLTSAGYTGYDFFGLGNYPRAIPDSFPEGQKLGRGVFVPGTLTPQFTPEEIEAQGEALDTRSRVMRARAPGNWKLGLTLGNGWQTNTAGGKFGVLFAGGYNNKHQTNREIVRQYGENLGELQTTNPQVDFDSFKTTYTVSYNGLLKLSWDVDSNNRLSLTGFYAREAQDETRDMLGTALSVSGTDPVNYTRQRYIVRGIAFTQLSGRHRIERAANMEIDYFASFSQARRDDPALREMVFVNPNDAGWVLDTSKGTSGDQIFLDLTDNNENGGLNLTFPFKQWKGLESKVKIGTWLEGKQRTFSTRRYFFNRANGLDSAIPEGRGDIINADTIGGGVSASAGGTQPFVLFEGTRAQDNYEAYQQIIAGYALLELPFVNWFKLTGGARIESSVIQVTPIDIYAQPGDEPNPALVPARLVDLDVLPSASLIFSPQLPEKAGDMNIRMTGTRTLARPEFRELAPFEFRDYVGGFDKQGNPLLTSTRIWNADLRVEWFPRKAEVVAISGFAKWFDDPIEEVVAARIPPKSSFANAKKAVNYGVEFEFRKALDFLAPKPKKQARAVLRDFSIGANFAYIYSRVYLYPPCYPPGAEPQEGKVELENCRPEFDVATSRVRPLQGQSPWVVNAFIDYDNSEIGTNVRLMYNSFGPRIEAVSAYGLPDIYQQPMHMIDVTASQRLLAYRRNDFGDLRNELSINLEITNLLNTPEHMTQGDEKFTTYRTRDGMSMMISLQWKY